MAFFSRPSASFYEPNYSGLFRLIDEFNNYAQEASAADADASTPTSASNNKSVTNTGNKRRSQHTSLPIWTPKFDLQETPNTYVLHGELPGIEKKDIHIEFIDEQTVSIRGHSERVQTHSSEDDEGAAHKEKESADNKKESSGKEVTHQDKDKQQVTAHKERPHHKYWVSERSFGEFARSFTFPTRVDSSGVVAKLDNGVLNLVIPKAAKPQGKKITVM